MFCWRIDTDDITIDNTDAFLLNKASIFHVAGHYEVFYCILLHVHSVRLNQYYRCRCNHMKRLKFIHVAHYFFFFIYFSAQSPRPLKNQCPIYKRRCELVTFFPRVIYLGIHVFTFSKLIFFILLFCFRLLQRKKQSRMQKKNSRFWKIKQKKARMQKWWSMLTREINFSTNGYTIFLSLLRKFTSQELLWSNLPKLFLNSLF